PVPRQLGHVFELPPNELAIRPSPPHTRQDSNSIPPRTPNRDGPLTTGPSAAPVELRDLRQSSAPAAWHDVGASRSSPSLADPLGSSRHPSRRPLRSALYCSHPCSSFAFSRASPSSQAPSAAGQLPPSKPPHPRGKPRRSSHHRLRLHRSRRLRRPRRARLRLTASRQQKS